MDTATNPAQGRLKDRHDRIRKQLQWLKDRGVILSAYTVRGSELRWHVELPGGISRAYTTAEIEAMLVGAAAVFERKRGGYTDTGYAGRLQDGGQ